MIILSDYQSKGTPNRGYKFPRFSLYHGIPISKLEETKTVLANLYPAGKFRIRYRGKRVGMNDGRTRTQQRQDCLKQYATSFAVYYR